MLYLTGILVAKNEYAFQAFSMRIDELEVNMSLSVKPWYAKPVSSNSLFSRNQVIGLP